MKSISVGIDVAKDNLVFCVREGDTEELGKAKNDASGIRKLISRLPREAKVHVEATGGYERLVKRALVEAGFEVAVHNPRRIRRFADVQGVSAKTDELDASVLSQASVLKAPAPAKSSEQEELCDLSRLIQRLKKQLAGHRKRLGTPGLSKALQRELRRLIRTREREVERLEAQYVQLVKGSSRSKAYELALTVPCVGPALAQVTSAELPDDLTRWNKRQIASLAGLAPMDKASGKSRKPSTRH